GSWSGRSGAAPLAAPLHRSRRIIALRWKSRLPETTAPRSECSKSMAPKPTLAGRFRSLPARLLLIRTFLSRTGRTHTAEKPLRRADVLPWVYVRLASVAEKLHEESLFHTAVSHAQSADAAAGGRTGGSQAARALHYDAARPPAR